MLPFFQYIGVISQIRNRFYIWHRFQLLFSFIVSCWDKIRKFIHGLICSIFVWHAAFQMMVIRDRTRSDNLKEQKIYIFADNCLDNQRKSYSSTRFFLDAQRRFRLALRFFRFAQPRVKTRRLTKQRGVYLHKLLLSCFKKAKSTGSAW